MNIVEQGQEDCRDPESGDGGGGRGGGLCNVIARQDEAIAS